MERENSITIESKWSGEGEMDDDSSSFSKQKKNPTKSILPTSSAKSNRGSFSLTSKRHMNASSTSAI
ncbi:MAG: hypothetical protein R2788_21440 [Saprospiraceae bacterium]